MIIKFENVRENNNNNNENNIYNNELWIEK